MTTRRTATHDIRPSISGTRRGRYGVVLASGLAIVVLAAWPSPTVRATSLETYVVTTITDSNDTCDADCSLREAITAANTHANVGGPDVIEFAILPAGPQTISPGSALPSITDRVTIDGTTQPGGSSAPRVTIDGVGAGGAAGLTVTGAAAAGTVIQGLSIVRFTETPSTTGPGSGIFVFNAPNVVIEQNYLGTDGSIDLGNEEAGLTLYQSNGATVRDNVISGNGTGGGCCTNGFGIFVFGGTTNSQITGNLIGTDAAGTGDLGNKTYGVDIQASGNTIGGTTPSARNVISGNDWGGLNLQNPAASNTVIGNYIGVDASGAAALPNLNHGVLLNGAGAGNSIGGTAAGAGNIISGNHTGILIDASSGATVQGNLIGVAADGTTPLGNSALGIQITSPSTNNTIGGTAAGAGNVVSANGSGVGHAGLLIQGSGSAGNVFRGNFIGTDAGGTLDLGNTGDGVQLFGEGGNTIGGTAAGSGNIIAHNSEDGVAVISGGTGSTISSNAIFDNGQLGIDLGDDGVTANDTGDGDTGANSLQNFPVIASATTTGIAGTFDSGGTWYRLEFFRVPACDASGYGEGAAFLGALDPQATGVFSFSAALIAGQIVTATAIDLATGDTSEFSACETVAAADAPSFTVNTTDDTTDTAGCTTLHCSLREAITRANGVVGTDTITFSIPGSGPHTITLASLLPTVSDPAIIDATTEPDFASCTTGPVVEIDGSGISGLDRDGLEISAGGTTVRGFVINRFSFPGRAIHIIDAGGNTIECNWIGTNAAGTAGAGNWVGLSVNSADNTIGGATSAARNVISGNLESGIRLQAADNVVQGNYIGTNAAGDAALGTSLGPNALGIFVNGSSGHTIGGTGAGHGNVISGNGGFGLFVNGFDVTVEGNLIGLNAAGTAAVGNVDSGIGLGDSTINNTIGGTTVAAQNVISGNGGYGIWVNGAGSASLGNVIAGNFIGTNAAGTVQIGNADGGIGMVQASFGSRHQTVGGTVPGSGNLISGNGGPGISISGAGSQGDLILGNSIHSNAGLGIDLTNDGVTLNEPGDGDTGANALQNFPVLTSATAGAPGSIEGTLDSDGASYRLEFFANPMCDPSGHGEGSTFLGALDPQAPGAFSFLATLADGDIVTATATNIDTGDTSEFSACATAVEADPDTLTVNTTADTDDGACTVSHCSLREAINRANALAGPDTISFDIPAALVNGAHTISPTTSLPTINEAVVIDGTTEPDFVDCPTGPIVELNGTNAPGDGLFLNPSAGGTTIKALAINRFSGNGVLVLFAGSNTFECNHIGLDVTGSIDLGNRHGVRIVSSDGNLVGGTAPEAGNVISGNDTRGLEIGGTSTGNRVEGNRIGTDRTGSIDLGNGDYGIDIGASGNNMIGGTDPGAGNLVSGNDFAGISLSGDETVVVGNLIGTDATGTSALGNVRSGISIESSASGTTIGGSSAAARNVISGNVIGVELRPGAGPMNRVIGNVIGTDPSGFVSVPSSSTGVLIFNADGNEIGGSAAGEGNVISGNGSDGISVQGTATGNLIRGNLIGTAADGITPLGQSFGVSMVGTSGNQVGGTTTGSGNVIAFNIVGVFVGPYHTGASILGNRIHSNRDLGIDLGYIGGYDGVTPNDPAGGDADTGANNLQNFPVLTSATAGAPGSVEGTLDSDGASYRIEFFANAACDPLGHGEGATFLGALDPQSAGAFSFGASLSVGDIVTATATDLATNDTSEFSACTTAVADQASLVVNTTDDIVDAGGCTVSHCSLREAILRAESLAGADTISFDIPGAAPHTIRPTSALPTVTDPVTIDGTSEPDFVSCAAGPVIEIDGTGAGASTHGLRITAGNSSIRGLVINRFGASGISFETGGANVLTCSYIGTDVAGSSALGNSTGVNVFESAGNRIGGVGPDDRNVISGNVSLGVFVGLGEEAAENVISGNYIGTDATGSNDLGNGYGGIALSSPRNRIGGTATGAGNVISGNDYLGIQIGLNSFSDVTDNVVQGNLIGTDASGTAAVGNTVVGVIVTNYPNNTIGGTAAGAGNLISGNGGIGVRIENPASTGNLVAGNRIGTDISGTADLGNGADGVAVFFASGNVVGGASDAARNVIAGNAGAGVHINGGSGNVVEGNRIGSAADGTGSLPNAVGVQVFDSDGNTIGGTATGAANLIVNSGNDGVRIGLGSTGNRVLRNSISSNTHLGIDLDPNGVTPNDPGDGDTGDNGLQNFPILGPVTTTSISGSLDSAAGTYRLEFFRNPTCDPSGHGEGAEFLGALDHGPGAFTFTAALAVDDIVSATATNLATGDTSEFSACATAVQPDVCDDVVDSIVSIAPPPSLVEGARESDTEIVLVAEQQGLILSAPLTVDLTADGCYNNSDVVPAGVVDADTVVDSYILHADNATEPSVQMLQGTWTFDAEILGVILIDEHLDAADGIAGWPYTTYPTGDAFRGAVLDASEDDDWLEIDPDGRTIRLQLTFSSAIDQVRVITAGTASPSLSIDDVIVDEGAGPATFTVSLSSPSIHTVKVTFGTADGTATTPDDYTASGGVLTFGPGDTSESVIVPIVSDALDEPDETFDVVLNRAANASIADPTGIGTIVDDDPTFGTIVIVKDAVPNAATDFAFTNTIPGCTVGPLDDDADGTLSNTATCANVVPGTYSVTEGDPALGSDLSGLSCDDTDSTESIPTRTASIAVAAGETVTCTFTNTRRGTIVIVKDAVPNAATDFAFTNTIPGCTVGPLDDDADGTLSNTATCANVVPGTYGVTESSPPAPYGLTGLSCDDDDSIENVGTRTASIALGAGETVTCTFTNTATVPSLSINDVVVNEGDFGSTTTATFQVTLSSANTTTVTVAYATQDLTATAPQDYTVTSGTLSFPAGVTTRPVNVTVIGDFLRDTATDEQFAVNLSGASANATIADGQGIATIIDEAHDRCTIQGTAAADTLDGTTGDDVICGLGNNDILNGGAGDDTFFGGSPVSDTATGDRVTFADSPAPVSADLRPGPGTATGWGSDILHGIEHLTGSDHNDTLTGDGGVNILTGGNGNDILDGRAGNDTLQGGNGADDWAIFDEAPNAVVVDLATPSAQTASGWGSDSLSLIENVRATPFNDTIQGSAADNRLEAGGGIDRIRYASATSGVSVNLDPDPPSFQRSSGWGDDLMLGFENITGSARDDRLTGSQAVNTIDAGGGNDTVDGRGAGDDLNGGSGTDRITYALAPAAVTVNLIAGTSSGSWGPDTLAFFENIFGSEQDDTLTGSDGRNEIFGNAGSDEIDARGGNDFVHGGQGNDRVNGWAGADELLGDDGNDTVSGNEGDDTISGNDGNDVLHGNDGDDGLSGGTGQDDLFGDAGRDVLVGGPGTIPDNLNGGPGNKDACWDSSSGTSGNEDNKVNCEIT